MIIQDFLFGLTCLVGSYFMGSIPSGYLAGKWLKNIDLREIGSGSTGATNVLRHVGKKAALIVFLIDVGKGSIPVLIMKLMSLPDGWQVAAGLFALAGHIWSIWLNWKGGKAVATGLGLFLGLSWPVGLASLAVFIIALAFSRIVSLSSIFAASSLPIFMFLSLKPNQFSSSYMWISLIAMALVLWRHRTNINRLIKGQEPKIGQTP
tara:strand:+ start:3742 stop:4362 length:621 start_codon:yes stop_codon:yes gene_type:complete